LNAGAINISVTATMEDFNRKMAMVKTTAAETAKTSGSRFGIDFGKEFGNKGGEILKQFAGPMMAATLAKSIANVMRSEKALPDAILDGIKSIPFVGAFADLGSAIYDATFGAADKAAEDLVKKQEAARDSVRQGSGMRESALREEQALQGSLTIENRRLEIQRETMKVRMSGSEIGIAAAEYEAKMSELQLQRGLDLAKTEDEQTKRLIQERFDLELGLAKMVRDQRVAAVKEVREKDALAAAENARKEAKAAEDAADAEAIARSKIAEKMTALREEAMKSIQEAEIAADEEARTAQSAGVGQAATALGSFTFDAYPETEKKRNDERIVKTLESIRDKQGGFA
jgi:hypothetical protein